MSAWNLRRRLEACFLASALNLSLMFLPTIESSYYWMLLAVILALNVAVRWLLLRGVPPVRESDDYPQLVVFSKRWLLVLFYASAASMLAIALSGHLHKQAIPFLLFGYDFLLVVVRKLLDISIDRRLDELEREPGE